MFCVVRFENGVCGRGWSLVELSACIWIGISVVRSMKGIRIRSWSFYGEFPFRFGVIMRRQRCNTEERSDRSASTCDGLRVPTTFSWGSQPSLAYNMRGFYSRCTGPL